MRLSEGSVIVVDLCEKTVTSDEDVSKFAKEKYKMHTGDNNLEERVPLEYRNCHR